MKEDKKKDEKVKEEEKLKENQDIIKGLLITAAVGSIFFYLNFKKNPFNG